MHVPFASFMYQKRDYFVFMADIYDILYGI